jgi:formylglycine-generating enzyme required for sulfatase activity
MRKPFSNLAALSTVVGIGCQGVPPRGEVVVFVDTDLPVPELASSMRVDVFTRDGDWIESGEVFLGGAGAWPASFGLVNLHDRGLAEALLRIRVFPEGATRLYRGEGLDAPVPWDPPTPKGSIEELCENVVELPVGGTVTLRRGRKTILPTWDAFNGSAECQLYGNVVGSVAARVTVTQGGHYGFAVVDTSPTLATESSQFLPQVTLELRRDCDDHDSGIACTHGMYVLANGYVEVHGARVEAELQPGAYHLVTGGVVQHNGVTDITLAAWSDDIPIFSKVSFELPPTEEPIGPWLRGDPAATPTSEPDPLRAIDRLAIVAIEPHHVRRQQLLLSGDCLGQPARLAEAAGTVVIDEASSCSGTGISSSAPSAPAPIDDETVPTSVQGTFAAGETCSEGDSSAHYVCVPSGAVELGSRDYDRAGLNTPPRSAAIRRFWIDRTELTVADFRADLARGLDLPADDGPIDNPTFPASPAAVTDGRQLCTWSGVDLGREPLPLTCITWYGARAWCQFRGGELPSSAQWEYAALRAGHDKKSRLPWGDEPPSCACDGGDPSCRAAVFERDPLAYQTCIASGFGPAPAAAIGGPNGDESPLGIVGLFGNVREWALDSALPLNHRCYQRAVWDPVCDEPFATARIQRGVSFVSRAIASTSTFFFQPAHRIYDTGVRCVYSQRPS